jgi:hypothetical protein
MGGSGLLLRGPASNRGVLGDRLQRWPVFGDSVAPTGSCAGKRPCRRVCRHGLPLHLLSLDYGVGHPGFSNGERAGSDAGFG